MRDDDRAASVGDASRWVHTDRPSRTQSLSDQEKVIASSRPLNSRTPKRGPPLRLKLSFRHNRGHHRHILVSACLSRSSRRYTPSLDVEIQILAMSLISSYPTVFHGHGEHHVPIIQKKRVCIWCHCSETGSTAFDAPSHFSFLIDPKPRRLYGNCASFLPQIFLCP